MAARPTLRDISERAGLSTYAVSRAIAGKPGVSASTRGRVLAIAAELGYVPNLLGRSLRETRTPMVGLVVADAANPFYGRLHKSLEAVFRERELTLMLLNSDDETTVERQKLELLRAYQPTGLIISPAVNSSLGPEMLATFPGAILVSRTLERLDAPAVVTNEHEVMKEATEALMKLGHRRVLAVLGPEASSTTKKREAGYRAAALLFGCEPLVRYTDQSSAGGRESFREAMVTDPSVTAAIAFNVPVTEGILAGLRDLGLVCPRDLSLIGFSDADWMEFVRPSITAVVQPIEAMGELAARLLLQIIDGESVADGSHVVESRLVLRESVAAPATTPVPERGTR